LKKNVRYFFLFYPQLYPFYQVFFFTFFTDGPAFFGKYSKKLFISSLVAMLLQELPHLSPTTNEWGIQAGEVCVTLKKKPATPNRRNSLQESSEKTLTQLHVKGLDI
jgi:hypothetical protein